MQNLMQSQMFEKIFCFVSFLAFFVSSNKNRVCIYSLKVFLFYCYGRNTALIRIEEFEWYVALVVRCVLNKMFFLEPFSALKYNWIEIVFVYMWLMVSYVKTDYMSLWSQELLKCIFGCELNITGAILLSPFATLRIRVFSQSLVSIAQKLLLR